MGDMAEVFNEIERRSYAPGALNQANISFTSFNSGAHLKVHARNFNVDFWPGTGRWRTEKGDRTGFGIRKLIDFIQSSDKEFEDA